VERWTRSAAGRRPRIALYSPDSYGLGHFRRTRRIAQAITNELPDASVLILTGCLAADRFGPLARTDIVRLPAATKSAAGAYTARSLGVDTGSLLRLRSAILDAAIAEFAPDIFVVDHSPNGLGGELAQTLDRFRSGRRPGLVVLGLRDIIDEPSTVRAQWRSDGTVALIARTYDEVWVYGRREVFDPILEYGVPSVLADRFQFLGYVTEEVAAKSRGRRRRVPRVMAMGGGGEDAFPLLVNAIRARAASPTRFRLTVLPGPLMGPHLRRELEREAAEVGPDVLIQPFTERAPALLAASDVVVTMGGYNSMLEVISAGVPSVVVPRVTPRAEQLIRAERMTSRGWTTLLHPDELTPQSLLERVLALSREGPGIRLPAEYRAGLLHLAQRCRETLGPRAVPAVLEMGTPTA